MADLLAAVAQLIAGVLQIVGEILVAIIGGILRAILSRPALDEDETVDDTTERVSNPWEILGYSVLGTLMLSLIAFGTCFYVWGTLRSALTGGGVVAFLGILGALQAATH